MQQKAFEKSREFLMSSQLLVHFDPKLEIHLACDTSANSAGAVLSHKMPDGSEQPVGVASRTLMRDGEEIFTDRKGGSTHQMRQLSQRNWC